MDVVLRYDLTNGEDQHLSGKYCGYVRNLQKCKNSLRVPPCVGNDQCHSNCNTVIVQSSLQPNEESKYNVIDAPISDNSKIKNNYQYFSDSELRKMPLDFENSSMKNSFSMSSLQPSSRVCLEQSLQATNNSIPTLPNRAYNSLTHKLRKRNPEQDSWRNSWGQDDQKDEFWTSFESNYQYLMNNNLIDSCKEVRNDISISHDWTFSRFKQRFLELDAWLNSIRNTIYANEDNQTVRNVRLNQLDKMKRKNYQRKNFLSQSSRLVTRCPEHKDEILEYVSQLNTKWDQITQAISPKRNVGGDCYNMNIDIHCELHCLSKWIRAMEKKVEPLNFRRKWTLTQLKLKAKEHELIQRDVESHGKTVQSVIKLCEKYSHSKDDSTHTNGSLAKVKRESSLKKAQRWEHRWHLLCLKCLEWQCYIEEQINSLSTENFDDAGAESDDEQPASKYRRLNGHIQNLNTSPLFTHKNENSHGRDLMDTDDNMVMAAVHGETVHAADIDMLGSEEDDASTSLRTQNRVDIPLNENFRDALRNLPVETLSKMIPPDFAMFNTTDVSSRNVGVYYIPHEDTDPELEPKGDETSTNDAKSADDSSDDEWTYKNVENCSIDTDASGQDASLNGDDRATSTERDNFSKDLRDQSKKVLDSEKLEPACIRRLVDKADELVQTTPKRATRKKCSPANAKIRHNEQVREWLRKCQQTGDYSTTASVGDSCDASSEYTTEDDDRCDRHSSCDQTLTMIGSSQDNGIDDSPVNEFVPIVEGPKVVFRSKSGSRKSRPFSTSELMHLSNAKLSSTQWVSESALHKMLAPLKDAQGTLSSSTIEECSTQTLEGSNYNVNSLRRRKLKHRRRSTLSRKEHSNSADSLSALSYLEASARHFYRSPQRLPALYGLKSDSFSEPMMMRRLSSVERAIASDPANCSGAISTSGTETEEELSRNSKKCLVRKKLLSLPAFRLGPQHGTVTRRTCNNATFSVTSAEEQLSSFSENAWDDFQERYVSEAYSEEPVDVDQVKKLTEFGDDYRNYIDSHSDCASSFTRRSQPIFGRYAFGPGEESSPPDSDSDLEDVRKLLQRSHAQLCCSQQLFSKQTAKPISCFCLSESDFADLRNTCRENVRCLRVLLDRIEVDGPLFTQQQTSDIKSMLDEWENLEEKTDEWERKCSLQRSIIELRKKLQENSTNVPNMAFQIEDRVQLENYIKIVKAELDSINNMKTLISEYNVKAHQLSNDSKYSSLSLEDDINSLYCIWAETQQKITRQFTTLEQALAMWSDFDKHMLELKMVLREEYTALNVLDQALKKDDGIVDMASAVQKIVEYLPEKHRDGLLKQMNKNSTTNHIDSVSNLLMSTLNVEGSFSDSGISDSGSEQDMFDREKRLALLRKLARHLEAILAPGSEALLNIMKKIDEAEEEIRELQQTYRSIKTDYLEKSERCLRHAGKEETTNNNFQKDAKIGHKTSPDDPGSDPSKGRSIFWRVLRAALPFHMVIVVLLCVACLLEPNCCDTINNLNLSLSPQLRYVSGPPPT